MIDYSNMIVITNRHLCQGDYPEQIRKVTALHPCSLILREKDLSDTEYAELAVKVREICLKQNVPFYIHSHYELGKDLGCENIHTSLQSLVEAGDLARTFSRISVSCHSLEDVKQAEQLGATQIVLGTIFETDCKKGLKGRGVGFVEEICRQTKLPVYAIGGIKPENLPSVMAAGAAGGCMMSGFMRL